MAERDWEPEYDYFTSSWGAFRMAESYVPPTTPKAESYVPESVSQAVKYYTTTPSTQASTTSTSWGAFRMAETYELPTTPKAESYVPESVSQAVKYYTTTPSTQTSTTSTSWGAFRMAETYVPPTTPKAESYVPESVSQAVKYYTTTPSTQTSTTSTSWGAFRILETTLTPTGWSEAYPEEAKEARKTIALAAQVASQPLQTVQSESKQSATVASGGKQTINGHVVIGTGKSGKPIYADDSPLVRWWKDIDNPVLHQIIGNFFGLFEWDQMSPEEREREMARREEEFQRERKERIGELMNEIKEGLIDAGYSADVAASTASSCANIVAGLPKIYVPPIGEPPEETKDNTFFILMLLLVIVVVVVLLKR